MTQTVGAEPAPRVGGHSKSLQGPRSPLPLSSSKTTRSQPSFLERLVLKEALGEDEASKTQEGLRRVGVCCSRSEV